MRPLLVPETEAPEPRRVIESLFKVETKVATKKGERIIPFKLKPAQLLLDRSTRQARKHVILKARQMGFSTYVEARFLAKCMTVNGTHAAVVSHEKEATMRLLRRVHFFLDNLPDSAAIVPREFDNKYEITFPKTHSSFYLGTAGARAFSRGDMITDFHGSEVAFWEDPQRIMTGVTGALTPDAEVFLESTANGMGGFFYNVCQKAELALLGKAVSPYLFHFMPWNLEKEYAIPVVPGTMWTPEELFIKQKYGLTFEQLMWRKLKKEEYDTEELFLQEFPINPEEAFIVSGTCYFDRLALRLYTRQLRDPIAVGHLDIVGTDVRFFPLEAGKVKIWEYPRPGVEYLITCDAAEGIDASDTDNTHLQVINRETMAQVASINGKIDPEEAGKLAFVLGKYYRWPVIAVEDNGPGLTVLYSLKRQQYPRIYRHRRWDQEKQQETEKLGWHTDARTRPLILQELRHVIKQQTYRILDEQLLKECTTFCKQDDGKYEANVNCHDDAVMANAIAVYLHKMLPYQPEELWDDGRDRGTSRLELIRGYKTGY